MLYLYVSKSTDEQEIVPNSDMNAMQTFVETWILILFGMVFAVIWKVFTFGFPL